MGSGRFDVRVAARWYGADGVGGVRMNGLSLLGYVVMVVMVAAWYVLASSIANRRAVDEDSRRMEVE